VGAIVRGMYDVLARPDGPVEGVAIAMVEVGVVVAVQLSAFRCSKLKRSVG
jgi:hypothetical protein